MDETIQNNILNSIKFMFNKQDGNFAFPKQFPKCGLGEIEALRGVADGVFSQCQ